VSDPVQALQTALAAEHAVIWGYALVGARVEPALRAQVQAADAAHRDRRDTTAALVRRLGGDPVPTSSTYTLPFRVADRPAALRLAVHLEEGGASAWRYVVAATGDRTLRRAAIAALTDAAVRATRWRRLVTPSSPTVPFPGARP
jgi:Domain of unknown function (DUF4439)